MPCLTTAPHLPPWTIGRLGARLRAPERRLSGWQACGGLSSAPQAAPKLRMFHFHRPKAEDAPLHAAGDPFPAVPLAPHELQAQLLQAS